MLPVFEENLIRYCAATLAGHKCASLFSCQGLTRSELEENILAANAVLSAKGLRVHCLKACSRGGLVYVYREGALSRKLLSRDVQQFLLSYGYRDFSLDGALETLAQHVLCGQDFPHEIGIFLDYPLSDVAAFIQNEGRNCRCVGCWKVYYNEEEARRTFALYRKCRDVYLRCYRRGFDVARLTVAA